MNLYRHNKKAFTIIELMLAMTFLSILLMAMAMSIIHVGALYNKGLTLKDVSQAGRSIASELQEHINDSTAYDLTNGNFVENKIGGTVLGGRLCLNRYTYFWNYGDAIAKNTIVNKVAGSSAIARFAKISDPNAVSCKKDAVGNYPDLYSLGVELLSSGQHNLAIHSFKMTSSNDASDSKTGQRLYNIEFVVGTNDIDALTSDRQACKSPNENGSDLNYCSVNRFNITVRAGRVIK